MKAKNKIYPIAKDKKTIYLNNVITDPNIQIGDYTIYNDSVNNPCEFYKNNLLYYYPKINNDKLIVGKFCSIACGVKFIFNGGNHTMKSFSSYPFPVFFEEWNFHVEDISSTFDNKGDIVIGNDVWIGYEAVIMAGVTIGDGAIIGTRSVVTKDVPPYTIVGGIPAKIIRKRFDEDTIEKLLSIRWWDWDIEKISGKLSAIQLGNIDLLCCDEPISNLL